MVASTLFWLGWLLCLVVLVISVELYFTNRRLLTDLALVRREYRSTLRQQQGMTFKFKKVGDQFIHTFCEGELAYRLGTPPEVALGKSLSEFIGDKEYVALKESYYERAWKGEEVSYQGSLNGIWYIASLSPIYRNGRVCEVVAACVDITQQKLVEQELRESEQMYRLIAESSADLIRILATDMTIRYASPSHLQVLGYEPSEIEGVPCSLIVAPDERDVVAQAFWEMVHGKKEHYQLNFHAVRKDGSLVLLETHGRLVFDENGEPTGVVVVARDLTKRRQEEAENRRREKLTLAGQLAAGIAHEIRNPLTAIKGFTQLLRTPSDKQAFYTEVIAAELARVESIVNEFLLLAKPQAGDFQTHDLDSVLFDVVTLLGPQAILQEVQIHLSVTSQHMPVYAVASQLKQVFINVIKNAIESMPDGGNVYISVHQDDHRVITLVKDEGAGIEKDSLQHLGEPFYTTKERGTGLGLMVSYQIVKDHGGDIVILDSSSEGTCIAITLPKAGRSGSLFSAETDALSGSTAALASHTP